MTYRLARFRPSRGAIRLPTGVFPAFLLSMLLCFGDATPARADAPGACAAPICWEVVSRFRFFQREADFLKHEQAWIDTHKADPAEAEAHPVARMQRALSGEEGRNWAAAVVDHVCFDDVKNELLDPCPRGGAKAEKYVNPAELPVRFTAHMGAGFEGAKCVWTAVEPKSRSLPERRVESAPLDCGAPWVTPLRRRPGAAVSVTAHAPDGAMRSETTSAEPKDILVVGMGDSVASGEGNPDMPVALKPGVTSAGFCFARVLSDPTQQFFLPRRDLGDVDDPPKASCPNFGAGAGERAKLERARARWLHAACHRSLYGHQLRAALALAIEDAHRSVTYVPLGCSGATIPKGLLGSQDARELLTRGGGTASRGVEAQVRHLQTYLNARPGFRQSRRPDLLLLSIGANDVGFGGLVADVTVQGDKERLLLKFAKQLTTVAQARAALAPMTRDFARLRAALKPLLGGDLRRVVFTPYGNPALDGDADHPCKATHRGFDLHPAFGLDGGKMAAAAAFVETGLIRRLLDIAACDRKNGACADRRRDVMAAALTHRDAFARHGVCAAAADDPAFDRNCLRERDTRNPLRAPSAPGAMDDAVNKPLACALPASDFAPYAPRARWVRTVDDSALAAMSYSDTLPLKASDIHDALWGLSAVVYGGAIHPTAEGHAAMADAALIEARRILERP